MYTEQEGGQERVDKEMDPGEMKPAAGAGSTEERCPICLEDFQDKAFVNACFHTFCFSCVVRWAETTTTSCPLCKTAFNNVIHNVRANDDYDVFKVVPKPSSVAHSEEVIDMEGALRSFRGYRTTRFSGQPSQSQPSTSSATVHVVGPRPSRHRRGQKKDTRKPAAIQTRRAVYSAGVKAQPLKSGSKLARVRDISASFFRSNPAAAHRLYPWLTRELTVVVGEEHVQFIIQIITSLIDKVDLRSDEFPSYLEPYLHEKTSHFIHEFISFAASPFDMIAYDQNVNYDWPESHPELSERREDATQESRSSDIQQRIFDEISSTSWDDPPPILETTSPGYLDHSSDTDYSGSEDTPTSYQTDAAAIVISDEESGNETEPRSDSIVLETNPNNLRAHQNVNTNQLNFETERHSNEIEQVEIQEEPLAIVDLTVENTTENVSDSVASTSRLQVQRSIKTKDPTIDYDSTDYEIQLFAENENESASTLIDYEPWPLDTGEKDTNTAGHTVDKTKHSSKNSKKRKHKSKRDDASKSYSDKRHHERRESRKEKTGTSSNSRDRSLERHSSKYRYKHSRHDHHSRSRSYESSRHKDRSSHSPSRSSRESRLYEREKGHCSKIPVCSGELSPEDSTPAHNSRQETGSSGQARSPKQVISLDEDRSTKSCKALSNELNGLEKQITDNKRDLLKSMLRRERIVLLRNSLHPRPPDPLPTPSSLRGGESVGDMQSELHSLESAILDGKKHLLRVMKRIEEDQADDSD